MSISKGSLVTLHRPRHIPHRMTVLALASNPMGAHPLLMLQFLRADGTPGRIRRPGGAQGSARPHDARDSGGEGSPIRPEVFFRLLTGSGRALQPRLLLRGGHDEAGEGVMATCKGCGKEIVWGDRQSCAEFFSAAMAQEPAPMNLKFCCEVLDLDPAAVIEAIVKRRLDPEALAQLSGNQMRGK